MQRDMLKKILPGLVPLLIFILAEELTDTKTALYIALATGIVQLIYFYVKDKRIDKFVLFDTLLILALGGVSILSDNSLFFKLKPALIEGILVFIIALSIFSKHNILLSMSKRYMKEGVEFKDQQLAVFRKQMLIMLLFLSVHILLIIYSALYWSDAAWGFISGVLFYVIIGVWALFMFIYSRIKLNRIEWLPIVNEKGEVTGKATREECHSNPDLLHPVIRIHIFRSNGKLLIQQRSYKSEIEPGKWDAACAGHVQFGETADQALRRETYEEVRIKIDKPQAIHQRIFKFSHQTELVLLYFAETDDKATANPKEVEAVKEIELEELVKMKDEITPALQEEIQILRQIRKTIILA